MNSLFFPAIPTIFRGRATAQTAAVTSLVTYTPSTDSTIEVGGNVNVTTSSSFSFSLNVTYTDETNSSRTATVLVLQTTGAGLAAISNTQGVGVYQGVSMIIRVKANTAITVLTSGTFTGVTYNAEGIIRPISLN